MKKTLSLALCCALIGCTTIDKQVVSWPQNLKTTEHTNSGYWKVQTECFKDMPPVWKALSLGLGTIQCTTVNLPKYTCDIYTIIGDASEHEKQHCKGGDHNGIFQEYFDRWMFAIDDEIKASPTLTHPLSAKYVAAWREDYTKRMLLPPVQFGATE